MFEINLMGLSASELSWLRGSATSTAMRGRLTELAWDQDHAGFEREHFLAWFRVQQKAEVKEAYAEIAPSYVEGLFAPQFGEHQRYCRCRLEWAWPDDFQRGNVVLGRFKVADGNR